MTGTWLRHVPIRAGPSGESIRNVSNIKNVGTVTHEKWMQVVPYVGWFDWATRHLRIYLVFFARYCAARLRDHAKKNLNFADYTPLGLVDSPEKTRGASGRGGNACCREEQTLGGKLDVGTKAQHKKEK